MKKGTDNSSDKGKKQNIGYDDRKLKKIPLIKEKLSNRKEKRISPSNILTIASNIRTKVIKQLNNNMLVPNPKLLPLLVLPTPTNHNVSKFNRRR